jgi:predicted component of type VI protein secretion system
MPVKLLVTRTTDASSADEYIFDRDTITIGRDASSHLTLPDLKRVVSKQHAELRREKGTYQIVDLGSKNFTYLNEERLQSSRPYDLKYGDLIRIGDFEIRLEPQIASKPDHDGTVFDVHFVNPFAEDAAQLTEALRGIRQAYEREAPSRREDALLEALQETFIAGNIGVEDSGQAGAEGEENMAFSMIARLLAPSATPKSPIAPPQSYASPSEPKPPHELSRPAMAPSSQFVPAGRLEPLVDVLLRAAARLVNIPWQFRHEFIGQTIMQSAETAAVHSGDADALKEYLLDDRIPEDEAERRRNLLADAAEEVALHQVAMMDGYKAGAEQGTRRLLDEFDPAGVEAAVQQEDAISRFLPPLAKMRALDRLKQKMQELKGQDWSVAERRIFRPAFIKAYLARMTSLRK